MPDDYELLRCYVTQASEQAFAELAARHVNLVYSAALRQVGDRHLAEDITQAVFMVLAKKARSIRRGTPLSGWLHMTTRYAAADALRARARRMRSETRAAAMTQTSSISVDWSAVAPVLDEAVSRLRTKDRQAILLRYFENKSLAQVGVEMGISPDAARMRLERAISRMRDFFRRRGVHVSAAALSPILLDHAIEPAPETLKKNLPSFAIAGCCSPTIASMARSACRLILRSRLRPVAATLLILVTLTVCLGMVATDFRSLSFPGFGAPRHPRDVYNYYARALRNGDAKAMLSVVHTTSDMERRRAESAVELNLAVARFRRACSDAFGSQALQETGFVDAGGGDFSGVDRTGYFICPPEAPLVVADGRVWIPLRECDVPMTQVGGEGEASTRFKIDEAMSWHLAYNTMGANGFRTISSDPEVLIRSARHMRELLDRVTKQVETGSVKTAKQAVDVLDDATHGLARRMPPRPASMVIDVAPQ